MIALREALARLRARRGRAALAAAGTFAAAIMVGTAATISYGLGTGFERATERADLPDLIARFSQTPTEDVRRRVEGLANVDGASYRLERLDLGIASRADFTDRTAIQVVDSGRRGCAIVDGSDLDGSPGEIVVERGLADEWGLSVGDPLRVDTLGETRIVGIAVAPDDVAYPLASRARTWVSRDWLPEFFTDGGEVSNLAMLWARDPAQLEPLLVQARSASYGLENLRLITESGVRTLVSQAGGIVIALLVAFSLVALGAAAVALGASARVDVQRRIRSIGVMRAVGISRAGVARRYALDALLIALPAGALGIGLGAAVAYAPSSRLLSILSELAPGGALILPLAGALALVVGIVVAATAWPAWRAAGQPPARVLAGGEISGSPRGGGGPGGPFGLGLRLASAKRLRTGGTALIVAAAASVVLLMVGLATFLDDLQNDPGTIGRNYEISADLGPDSVEEVRQIDGVAEVAPRYQVDALDSFQLTETVRLIGLPADGAELEAPPLDEGRRVANPSEIEVGRGLADALGLRPGATLAAQLPSGEEARFTVVGIVSAIDNDGRLGYVRASRLEDAGGEVELAVKLAGGADPDAVRADLVALGASPSSAADGAGRDQKFLGILADVLRVVAGVNGLIALYILVQALAAVAIERRSVIAVLRSSGADRRAITTVLAGTALVIVAVAAPLAVFGERLLLGPLVADLAAGYASPDLAAGLLGSLGLVAGMVVIALIAASWVAGRAEREPIAGALRGE
ncbi:MAG: FtsX-like permease family protein [Solirubrobacterales bacterium]